jgi:hypothetical protein
MESILKKEASGTPLNKQETSAVSNLQKYLGSSSTKLENLRQVIDVAKAELAVLKDQSAGVDLMQEELGVSQHQDLEMG